MGWELQLVVWIAAQGDRVPIKFRPAELGPPVQPWDRLYRPPYEPRPLLKPGRAALRNLGPGNKRKIGFVCQEVVGCRVGGLKFEGNQGWKLKEVPLGKWMFKCAAYGIHTSPEQHVCLTLCRLACVAEVWLYVCAAAYVSQGEYGIHTLHTWTPKRACMCITLECSLMHRSKFATQASTDVTEVPKFERKKSSSQYMHVRLSFLCACKMSSCTFVILWNEEEPALSLGCNSSLCYLALSEKLSINGALAYCSKKQFCLLCQTVILPLCLCVRM